MERSKKKLSIEELLKNEKVEWKRLGEVGVFFNGLTGKTKQDFMNGNCKYITYKNIYNNIEVNMDLLEKVKIENEKQNRLMKGDVLFTGSSENLEECGLSSVITNDIEEIYLNSFCFGFRFHDNIKILPNFSKYLFRGEKIRKQIIKTANGVTRFNVSKEKMKKVEIPIPSIEVQEKIIKILDKFTNYVTELQVELQAELQARNKQYVYYRDMLLSEEYLQKISKKLFLEKEYKLRVTTLGEIGKFTRGNGLQKKDFLEIGKPVIHYGEIYTKYGFSTSKTFSFTSEDIFLKLRKAKPNDILMATTSENIEDVGKSVVWLGEEEVGISGDMYSYSTKENSKYIAYYFQTSQFQRQKERKVSGTKLIRIHSDDMKKFEIILPPIEIQEKVVEILDEFQKLVDETSGLLPKEIEKRKKQYEYFREKLLTFSTECDRTNERTNERTIIL